MVMVADMVDAKIPLLVSLPTMKKMKLSIHTHKDEGSREDGARAKLYTRSNHHWVRLLKQDALEDNIEKKTHEQEVMAMTHDGQEITVKASVLRVYAISTKPHYP